MKHVARKRFGQNFLTDAHVLSDIIDAIARAAAKPWSKSAPAWRR
jgi:16S rRNA A1518/A1519 N6-dimethyltransferase RsmA/KsgA/DIM1 with predicted DNA glycosylase/AP lyase activity